MTRDSTEFKNDAGNDEIEAKAHMFSLVFNVFFTKVSNLFKRLFSLNHLQAGKVFRIYMFSIWMKQNESFNFSNENFLFFFKTCWLPDLYELLAKYKFEKENMWNGETLRKPLNIFAERKLLKDYFFTFSVL